MGNQILTCEQCGKSYKRKVTPSARAGGAQFRFCSPSCRNKARILENVPCPICGKQFKPKVDPSCKRGRKTFCSVECANIARRGIPSNKRTDKEIKRVILEIYPSQGASPLMAILGMTRGAIQQIAYKCGIKLNQGKYTELVHDSARAYMSTKNNPNYRDGSTLKEWGENWVAQRKLALQRDSQLCQVCFEVARSVHHIKPRRFFIGHMEDANELSNLITLCSKHHLLVEYRKIPCPKPNH